MLTHTRFRGSDTQAGSVAWAMLVSLAVLVLGSIFTVSIITTVQRSKATTDATILTQYTDTATADAIARLNAGSTLPRTLQESIDTADQTCEKVSARSICWRYWAMPVPGSAVDPVRYDLVSRVWLDQDGDELEPTDGLNVRSTKLPLEVITYQTGAGLGPTLQDGYVAYNATPAGLFANAIYSFSSTNLEGPNLKVRSYNSATGDTGTGTAAVSSSGWVTYGKATQADSTVLFAGAAPGGDRTSRCTGEACEESDVRVVDATYAAPTVASTNWMRTVGAATCDTTFEGDWIVSERSFRLPAGETCINGSLIVDGTAATTTPLTTVFVNGLVVVNGSLNAPSTGLLAEPASLVIYSTGDVVSFTPPANSVVNAMIYAPLATCGTNPANSSQITYFGSLVCDVVSLGGSWDHLYDEAATASYQDPVPGAKKTYSPGVPSTIAYDEFLMPTDWAANTCVYAPPAGSTGYWKLDEATGPLARDSAGQVGAAGWSGKGPRVDGVCGKGTGAGVGGASVVGSQPVTSTNGMTVEYWAKDLVGTAVEVGGVKITHDAARHVSITMDGTTFKFPFSVENDDKWHMYTVSITTSGTATLYVDGIAKKTVSTSIAPASLSGPLSVAAGTQGAVDEVAYYPSVVTATSIADRYTWWTSPLKIDASVQLLSPGVPFSAPGGFTNDGSSPTSLKVKWTTPTGTFPTTSSLTGHRVEQSSTATGPWTQVGTTAGTGTSFTQASPAPGYRWYRVCATYNGDEMCSASAQILTLARPAAPVVSVGTITTTTAAFSWTTPTYTASFESQYRLNGGTWTGAAGAADPAVITHALATPNVTHGPTTQGTRIEIRVRAVNAAGASPWSTVAVAQLALPAPTLQLDLISGRAVVYSWNAVSGASDYVLAINGTPYWATSATSVRITRPVNVTDKVEVMSRNAYTTSPYSAELTVAMPRSQLTVAENASLRANPVQKVGAEWYTAYGSSLVSPNGRWTATIYSNGSFVVRDLTNPNDAANYIGYTVAAGAGAFVAFQTDGNLVLYNQGMTPVAQTQTYSLGAQRLEMQDDGNLVVYTAGWTPLWARSWGTGNAGEGSTFMTKVAY